MIERVAETIAPGSPAKFLRGGRGDFKNLQSFHLPSPLPPKVPKYFTSIPPKMPEDFDSLPSPLSSSPLPLPSRCKKTYPILSFDTHFI